MVSELDRRLLGQLLLGDISPSDIPSTQLDSLLLGLSSIMRELELGPHGQFAAECLEILDTIAPFLMNHLDMQDLEQGIVDAELRGQAVYCHPDQVTYQ